jgi:hypothetical protein
MRSKQTGITLIGFVLLVAMVGVLGMAGIKLTPIYLENMKIRRVLSDVKMELDGQNPTPQLIRRSLDKRMNVEMISDISARDFEVEKSNNGFVVAARYERHAPFIANIYLMVEFGDEVEIQQ